MTTGWYKVQLWLDEHMIEEPTLPLAQVYADVIKLRIAGLPGRRLKGEPVGVNELAYPAGGVDGPGDRLSDRRAYASSRPAGFRPSSGRPGFRLIG